MTRTQTQGGSGDGEVGPPVHGGGGPAVVLSSVDGLTIGAIRTMLELGATVVVTRSEEEAARWLRLSRDLGRETKKAGELVVDLRARLALWRGQRLYLTDLEFRVLATLGRELGRAWSFSDLRCEVWGVEHLLACDSSSLRSVIQRLRRKLDASDCTIESVRGYGYRFSICPGEDSPSQRR